MTTEDRDLLSVSRLRLAGMVQAAEGLRYENDGWTQKLAEEVRAYIRCAETVAGMEPVRDRQAAMTAITLGELLARAGRETVRYIDAQTEVQQ